MNSAGCSKTVLVLLCLVGFWGGSSSVTAQERPAQLPLDKVFRAVACYGNLNYTCVVDLVGALPRWYASNKAGVLPKGMRAVDVPVALEAGRILGVSYLALGDEAKARRVFYWMLMLDPSYMMSGAEISPNFTKVYFDVRASLLGPIEAEHVVLQSLAWALAVARRERAERVALRVRANVLSRPKPEPEKLVTVIPHVGAQWVGLSGQDAEVYGDAPGVALGIDVGFEDSGWKFGALVLFSQHDVLLEDLLNESQNQLQVLHIAAVAGHEWRFQKIIGLRPLVGAGATSFGVEALLEQVSLSSLLGAEASVYVGNQLRFHVEAEVWGLTFAPEGEFLTSVLYTGGGGIGFVF